jgi:hypothetical protein
MNDSKAAAAQDKEAGLRYEYAQDVKKYLENGKTEFPNYDVWRSFRLGETTQLPAEMRDFAETMGKRHTASQAFQDIQTKTAKNDLENKERDREIDEANARTKKEDEAAAIEYDKNLTPAAAIDGVSLSDLNIKREDVSNYRNDNEFNADMRKILNAAPPDVQAAVLDLRKKTPVDKAKSETIIKEYVLAPERLKQTKKGEKPGTYFNIEETPPPTRAQWEAMSEAEKDIWRNKLGN